MSDQQTDSKFLPHECCFPSPTGRLMLLKISQGSWKDISVLLWLSRITSPFLSSPSFIDMKLVYSNVASFRLEPVCSKQWVPFSKLSVHPSYVHGKKLTFLSEMYYVGKLLQLLVAEWDRVSFVKCCCIRRKHLLRSSRNKYQVSILLF